MKPDQAKEILRDFAASQAGFSALCREQGIDPDQAIRALVKQVAPGDPNQNSQDVVPEELHLTDLGNAKRLARRHRGEILYAGASSSWFIWDETAGLWRQDTTGEITRRAEDTILAGHAASLLEPDKELRDPLVKHFLKSEGEPSLRRMVTLAAAEKDVAVTPDQFDRDPWLLNLQNGVLDLRSTTLSPHNREGLHTKQSTVAWDPAATCPGFTKFIDEITCQDTALRTFLQRALGYSLTGDTREHAVFFPFGDGSNGKSTLLEIVRDVLGTYSASTEAATFLASRDDSRPRNDIARLPGVRFLTAVESEEGARLAEGLVKSVTGGDTISARFLYGEFFDFRPSFKLWFATNHKPFIRGSDLGIWRRIKLLPFKASFPEEAQDKTLGVRLLRDEGPGILKWLVDGCLDWQEHALGSSEAVAVATQDYRHDQDIIGRFIEERCTTGPAYSETAGKLYQAFRSWMMDEGETPWTAKAFGLRLVERGFKPVRNTKCRYWEGLSADV